MLEKQKLKLKYYLIKFEGIDSGNDSWTGYNIKTDETNMKESGIIDPLKLQDMLYKMLLQ